MLVKDYLQALTDEGLIRVEKIGSGNWYWAFVSDAKKSKEKILADLVVEEKKLGGQVVDLEASIEEERKLREEDEDGDEMLEDGEGGEGREALLALHVGLLKEKDALDAELAGYSDNDPTEVLRKRQEMKKLKESAERWTDNLESLQRYLRELTMDKSAVAAIMEACCGDEWVVGEGLKDL
jgi:chromosome segregation ATPase